MMSNTTVIKQDFMCKRSLGKSFFGQENFKSRWFILTPSTVKYYDGTLETGPKTEKGQISLSQVKVVAKVEELQLNTNPNSSPLQVVYQEQSSGRIFPLYIIANKEEQREEWIRAITTECAKCGAAMWPMYHPGVWTRSSGQYSCCNLIDRRAPGCQPVNKDLEEPVNNNNSRHIHLKRTEPPQNESPFYPPQPQKRPPLPDPPRQVKKVVALYNYEATQLGDLSLRKGEEYEILDDKHENWWKARSSDGHEGHIPANYVKVPCGLEGYSWYYPNLTRSQGEGLLKHEAKEGCFIIRDSSLNGKYTLSVYCKEGGQQGIVRHYHIKETDGLFCFSERHAFNTIPELINYHKHDAGGLVTRLRVPPSESGAAEPNTAGLGYGRWELDPNELHIMENVGNGEFGAVFRAKWRGKKEVAVKMMKEGAMSEDQFIDEAKTMTQLQHPNLVQLYGVCTNTRPIYIVTEFMVYGALLTYISGHRKNTLLRNPPEMLDICLQVCRGMAYLEEQGIIHRDLAARNCLVGNNVYKVGDFGLARFVLDDEYTSSSGAKFPIRWAAPEALNYCRFSSKSDIWAFGVLMWEVFTGGDMPYSKKWDNKQVVMRIVEQHYRLPKPLSCPDNIYDIMKDCWLETPEDRPTFSTLQNKLYRIQENEPELPPRVVYR